MKNITEEVLEIFHDSLDRCNSNKDFLKLFYENFIEKNSDIQKKFYNVDMKKQRKMVSRSFYMIMLASQGNDAAVEYLEKISELHSKEQLDIHPGLYDLWVDSLITTVGQVDTKYAIGVEQAWREVMSFGIDYLKSHYDSIE